MLGPRNSGSQRLTLVDWLAAWAPADQSALHSLLLAPDEDEWCQIFSLAPAAESAPDQPQRLQLRGLVERDAAGGFVRASGSVCAQLDATLSSAVHEEAKHALPQNELQSVVAQATSNQLGEVSGTLEAALGVAELGVVRIDLLDDSVHWDANFCAFVGVPFAPQSRRHHEWQAVIHPEDRPFVQADLRRLPAGGDSAALAFRLLRADGGVRYLSVRHTVRCEVGGEATGITLVAMDVTEQHQIQAARQAQVLAERANHAKSEFLARMSHELRTPLNAILGFTEILETDRSPALTGGQRKRVERIRTAGGHLLELINDLLDVSRIETGVLRLHLVPVDLLVEVHEALRLVNRQAIARQVTLDLELPERTQVFWVHGDSTRLRQVVLNLLSNAIKYNRPLGRVLVTLAREGEQVILNVKDTGLGMNTQRPSNIFQPVNRLGKEYSAIDGAGIGLVIAKHLVELMGGEVQVSGQSQLGTEFWVRLPSVEPFVVQPEVAALVKPETVPASSSAPLGRVLYIEDHPVNRALIEGYVSLRPGIELELAVDGESGIAAAVRQRPDLILIDMMLPDLHGLQVIQRLREIDATRSVRCIAVSANAMPQQINDAAAAGFDSYLTKPVPLQLFLTELDRLAPQRCTAPQSTVA